MRPGPNRIVVLAREALIRQACSRALEFFDVRFLREGAGWGQIQPLLPLRLLVLSTSFREWRAILREACQQEHELPVVVVADPQQSAALQQLADRPGIHPFVCGAEDEHTDIRRLVCRLQEILDGQRDEEGPGPCLLLDPPAGAEPTNGSRTPAEGLVLARSSSQIPGASRTSGPASPAGRRDSPAELPEQAASPGRENLEHLEGAFGWLRSRVEALMEEGRAALAERDAALDELRRSEALRAEQSARFRALEEESRVLRQQLDHAGQQLEEQDELLSGSELRLAELDRERAALQVECEGLRQESSVRALRLEQLEREGAAERDALREEIEGLARHQTELEHALAEERRRAAAELDAGKTRLAEREQELGERAAELEGCRAELEGCRAELEGCRAELEGCRAELEGCRAELAARRSDLEGARHDLALAASERRAKDEALGGLSAALAEANAALDESRTAVDTLRQEVRARQERLTALETRCGMQEQELGVLSSALQRAEEELEAKDAELQAERQAHGATREALSAARAERTAAVDALRGESERLSAALETASARLHLLEAALAAREEELLGLRQELNTGTARAAELEAELSATKSGLESVGQQLREEMARLASRDEELADRTARLEAAEEACGRAGAELAEQQERCEELASHMREQMRRSAEQDRRNVELEALVSAQQAELAGLQAELAGLQAELAGQRAGLAAREERLAELGREQEETADELRSMRQRHAELSREYEEARARSSRLASELERGRTRVGRLEDEIHVLHSLLEESESTIESLRKELCERDAELAASARRCEEQAEAARADAAALAARSAELQRLAGELKTGRELLARSELLLEETKCERDRAISRATELEGRAGTLGRRLADAEERSGEARRALAARDAELASCRSELQSSQSELASCRSALASCGDELASCRSELASCRSELASCGAALACSQSELASCRSELASCRSELASCRSALAERDELLAERDELLAERGRAIEAGAQERAELSGQLLQAREQCAGLQDETALLEELLELESQETARLRREREMAISRAEASEERERILQEEQAERESLLARQQAELHDGLAQAGEVATDLGVETRRLAQLVHSLRDALQRQERALAAARDEALEVAAVHEEQLGSLEGRLAALAREREQMAAEGSAMLAAACQRVAELEESDRAVRRQSAAQAEELAITRSAFTFQRERAEALEREVERLGQALEELRGRAQALAEVEQELSAARSEAADRELGLQAVQQELAGLRQLLDAAPGFFATRSAAEADGSGEPSWPGAVHREGRLGTRPRDEALEEELAAAQRLLEFRERESETQRRMIEELAQDLTSVRARSSVLELDVRRFERRLQAMAQQLEEAGSQVERVRGQLRSEEELRASYAFELDAARVRIAALQAQAGQSVQAGRSQEDDAAGAAWPLAEELRARTVENELLEKALVEARIQAVTMEEQLEKLMASCARMEQERQALLQTLEQRDAELDQAMLELTEPEPTTPRLGPLGPAAAAPPRPGGIRPASLPFHTGYELQLVEAASAAAHAAPGSRKPATPRPDRPGRAFAGRGVLRLLPAAATGEERRVGSAVT